MDTRSVIARFEGERQALAMMDHPGIAKVFDAGASRTGRSFFAMELVAGERITDFCDHHRLSIPQRLELFARVCEAVQHAHQKGIIHRDLKPSNILVTERDGLAQPKVIDFGVAKATARQRLADQTIYTAFDQFVGTPAYMSPEQAGATGEDVDTRSDIYSLGVLLYELLTGRPPFEPERLRQAAVDDVFRIIRDEDPARPSTRLTTLSAAELSEISHRRLAAPSRLLREVRGDLDWIVMKALEKLPARRYETANAFALEVRRYLNHEPVLARPPSAIYRLGKTIRRHKLVFGASAAVLAGLVAGVVFSTWRFLKEQEARRQAVASEAKARAQTTRAEQMSRFLRETLSGIDPHQALGRDTTMFRTILDRAAERVGHELKEHPDLEAELRTTIGESYQKIGELGMAAQQHRSALRLREAVWGPTNGNVADSLLRVTAVLNRHAGAPELAEGESLARRTVAIYEILAREDEATQAAAFEQLAWNLHGQARWTEAEPYYRRVLDIRRRLPGTPLTELLNSLNALSANLSFGTNKLDEAESLIREALTLEAKAGREAGPNKADLLQTLSLVLRKRQKFPEATEAIRGSIALRRKLWGETNVMAATPLIHLAQALIAENKFDEAEAPLRESIAILGKIYGNGNLRLSGHHLTTLIELLHRQKKWAEAETATRELIAVCRANPGADKPLFNALHWQAIILSAQQKWMEAEPSLREALGLCDRLAPQSGSSIDPMLCFHVRRSLGEALIRQGRFAEAEPLLLGSYEGLRRGTARADAVHLEQCLRLLVELCEATGRPGQAVEWKQKLADFQQSRTNKGPTAPNP